MKMISAFNGIVLTKLALSIDSSIFCIWLDNAVCFSANAFSNSLNRHMNAHSREKLKHFHTDRLPSEVHAYDHRSTDDKTCMFHWYHAVLLYIESKMREISSLPCINFMKFDKLGVSCRHVRQPSVNASFRSIFVACFLPYFVI